MFLKTYKNIEYIFLELDYDEDSRNEIYSIFEIFAYYSPNLVSIKVFTGGNFDPDFFECFNTKNMFVKKPELREIEFYDGTSGSVFKVRHFHVPI